MAAETAPRVVVVSRFTPTDVDPGTGDWEAVGFPDRRSAEEWTRSDGWDLWHSGGMILDLQEASG